MTRVINLIILVGISLFNSSTLAGSIRLDFTNVRSGIVKNYPSSLLSGDIQSPSTTRPPMLTYAWMDLVFKSPGLNSYWSMRTGPKPNYCPIGFFDITTRERDMYLLNRANELLSQTHTFGGSSWSENIEFYMNCRAHPDDTSPNKTSGVSIRFSASLTSRPRPPSANASLCNFTNSPYVVSVKSGLDVDIVARQMMNIGCGDGTPIDYKLTVESLGNHDNGRLIFGNGVSAQISVDGTPLSVNGTGIILRKLTTRTIPLEVKFYGRANGFGESLSSGILILTVF